MDKAKDFNNCWKKEVAWLAEAERQAYADWKPSGLPETCEQDIVKHKVCVCVYVCMYVCMYVWYVCVCMCAVCVCVCTVGGAPCTTWGMTCTHH